MNQASLYGALANALTVICPNDFTEAKIEAEVHDDWSKTVYTCKVDSNWSQGLEAPVDADFEVDEALVDIRKAMTVPGQKPWSKCKFTLFPDGTFKFDVEYDD
jgi:hypothetical protein